MTFMIWGVSIVMTVRATIALASSIRDLNHRQLMEATF